MTTPRKAGAANSPAVTMSAYCYQFNHALFFDYWLHWARFSRAFQRMAWSLMQAITTHGDPASKGRPGVAR